MQYLCTEPAVKIAWRFMSSFFSLCKSIFNDRHKKAFKMKNVCQSIISRSNLTDNSGVQCTWTPDPLRDYESIGTCIGFPCISELVI